MKQRDRLRLALSEHDAGRRVALCVVVATRGSTPQPPGAMIVVDEAAAIHGTLGGGCVEADIRRLAHQQLSEPTGRLATFELDHDFGYDDGMICGGQMDVAIQPIAAADDVTTLRTALEAENPDDAVFPVRVVHNATPVAYRVRLENEPRLIIAGAGHIGRILSELTVKLGFDVHVADDRAEHANARRFPPPITLHVGDIAATLGSLEIDANTYVVIVTRGHKHDEATLRTAISTSARYIGMIGSRRKIDVVYEDLRHEGVEESQLARVHAPIGLDIGAVTADEIALSIAAEIVQVRRSSSRPRIEGPVACASSEEVARHLAPLLHNGRLGEVSDRSKNPPESPLGKGGVNATHTPSRILGIVPAAGMSRRMGRTKQSLPFAESTITGTVVRTMLEADVAAVVVVTRTELAGKLDLPTDQRLTIVFNDEPNTGMIDSVRIGLTHLTPDPKVFPATTSRNGVLVVPGDMPTVPLSAYQQAIKAFRSDPTKIVIASHGAKRGHPIVFPLTLATALDEITGGLNDLPRQFPHLVTTVTIPDPGVLRDIDDPAGYDELRA